MKLPKFLFVAILIFISPISFLAQCPTSSLTLSTQADVDDFPTNYPGCTILAESLIIDGNGITNLNGLSSIQEVEFLVIKKTSLVNLTGLDNLSKVETSLTIEFNNSLTSLTGLANLQELGRLWISSNPDLGNISDLANLTTLYEGLHIAGNHSLTSLDGLQNSTLVGSGSQFSSDLISIVNNDALTSLEHLTDATIIDGSLNISFNDVLVNFNALTNVTRVESSCNISYNPMLTSLQGLNNLEFANNLNIKYNDVLPNLQGLNNLNSIQFRLDVSNNLAIENLSGINALSSLETIWIRSNGISLTSLTGLENISSAKEIWIEDNDGLISMTGFNGLIEVTEDLLIEHNAGLIDLAGLNNLIAVGNVNSTAPNLRIFDNSSLQSLNGLDGLTNLIANLSILSNDLLVDLTGLENLTSVTYLAINNNAGLQNLTGLSNLATIQTSLFIYSNSNLMSIMDLTSLNTVPSNQVGISNNPSLSLCHADGICDLIENHPTIISISNNAVGCSDEMDVESFCDCQLVSFYPDTDGDGFGDGNATPTLICDGQAGPPDFVDNDLDCDDNNANDVHLVINDNPVTTVLNQAILTIESAGTVIVDPVLITFQAGESVTLKNGFRAIEGSNFIGKLDNCGSTSNGTLVQEEIEYLENSSLIEKENSYETTTKTSIKIYPNPAQDLLFIEGKNINQPFYIFDLIGHIRKNGNLVTGTNQISIEELESGMYFIQVNDTLVKFVKM